MNYTNPYERDTSLSWAYNAGSNDSYYRRASPPHYFKDGNKLFGKEVFELNDDEIEAYRLGYDHNEILGDFKDWG